MKPDHARARLFADRTVSDGFPKHFGWMERNIARAYIERDDGNEALCKMLASVCDCYTLNTPGVPWVVVEARALLAKEGGTG